MDLTLDPHYIDFTDDNDNTPDDSDLPPAPSSPWPPVSFLDLDDLPF